MSRSRWYVGHKGIEREAFRSATEPTENTHGHLYAAVVGPFRTKRAAVWAASPAGRNNPHYQHVNDAERIAKEVS